jgi:lipopolysaccharide transport system ATP-binding protein
MSRAEITRKFDEIVDFAEVEKFLDTPVKRYSSGMYVRLAFAVAAHLEPEILIVDEVLAVGDAQFQKKCLGKMEDVGKEGRTVIFVSHNMSTIQALCSRCLLLQNHSIYSDTTPSSAVRLYLEDNSAKTRFSRQPRSFDKPKFVSGSLHIDDHYNVQVAVQIVSDSARSVCLECQLVDELSVPVAFGDLGTLGSGRLLELSHGTTNVVFQFPGNRLATGNYYLSLDLTMPGIEYFDRAENCLLLEIIRSSQDGSSRVLDQSWGRGSFDLSLQLAQSF